MNSWNALVGRITIFPGPPATTAAPSALDLFQQVWQSNPDNLQSSPNPLNPTVAFGKRGNLTVGCAVQPTRIDFNLTPPPGVREEESLSFLVIEDTRQLKGELVQLIQYIRQARLPYPVLRVALLLHFLTLTSNIRETNERLIAAMPETYRPRISNEEDFVFQVNRPRSSAQVAGIRLNFITKWSMDRFQVLRLAIPMAGPPPESLGVPPQQTREFISASVVFDSNNVPASSPLDREQQAALLLECLGGAEEGQRLLGLGIEGFSNH